MASSKDPNDITRRMMQDLEVQMFYGMPTPPFKLLKLLEKLGIKSAVEARASRGHGALNVEPLDAVLKSVTFDMQYLGKWKKGDDDESK